MVWVQTCYSEILKLPIVSTQLISFSFYILMILSLPSPLLSGDKEDNMRWSRNFCQGAGSVCVCGGGGMVKATGPSDR